MSHTPGPWKWLDYPDGRKLLLNRDRAVIHCPDAPMTCDPADACLIAAAPELLDALNAWREFLDLLPGSTELTYGSGLALVKARELSDAAIAKAEGR
jgi:hypothetical protein